VDALSPPDAAPMPARIATALATVASAWCLESAHLLSPRATALAVALLLIAEGVAVSWPVPARRIAFPLSLVAFGFAAFERIAASYSTVEVSDARPLGAFLTAGAMVVLALAGTRRRDLFARIGLLMATTGLALTAGASAAITPAIVVGLATGAAMVALERAVLTSVRTAAQSRQPPPLLARTRLIAVPLAATAALTAYLASNASLPQHHSQTSVGNPTGSEGTSNDRSSTQTRLNPASGVMDLRVRGSLSNHAVARIEPFTADQGPQLWRAAVMDGYDGTRWYLADNPDPVTADGSEQVDQVTPIESNQLPLLTPGTALRLVTDDSTYDDPPFPQTVDGRYEVTSVVPVADAEDISQVPKAATRADEDIVDVPSVPARVIALSRQLTANATTRQQAVDAVVSYLHAHETYKLDSPVPAKAEDAVDDFLFHSHTGFCEQFASAAAILLQSSGVPTRVVTGYASGERQSDGSWLLRGSDAHAWIEVEYPGVGWLPVDPTAGVRLAPSGSGWHWQPLAYAGIALLLVGLVLAGIVAARRRRASRVDPLRHGLVMLDAALGSARRQPTESLRDLAVRLPLSPTERNALGTAERAFYGAAPMDANEIHAAATTMRRTARRLRRERVVPRRRRVRH
jgi:transglutaminase-like putative cysteine protease